MKFRIVILVSVLILFSNNNWAQVTIGSVKPPEDFCSLELDSGKGGLRLNQLDTAQKGTLTKLLQSQGKETGKGLTIYDLATKTIQYWDGSKWIKTFGMENLFSSDLYLQSKGKDATSQWATIKFPVIRKGEYYLHSSQIVEDNIGDINDEILYEYGQYNAGDPLESNWSVIDGLTVNIDIPEVKTPDGDNRVKNKVAITFQTTAQIGTGLIDATYYFNNRKTKFTQSKVPYISFAIGFFVGPKDGNINEYTLQLVRTELIKAVGHSASADTYTIEGTLENLPSGTQTVKVAVRRRTQDDSMTNLSEKERGLAVGTIIPNSNRSDLTPFMTRSFMEIKTYVLDWN